MVTVVIGTGGNSGNHGNFSRKNALSRGGYHSVD